MPMFYRPYPRILKCLTNCSRHSKGSTFPECWMVWGLNLQPFTLQSGALQYKLTKWWLTISVTLWNIHSLNIHCLKLYWINRKTQKKWYPGILMVDQKKVSHKLLFKLFLQRERWRKKRRQVGMLIDTGF